MNTAERRTQMKQLTSKLRVQLNPDQVVMFHTLEGFGWGILFIRHQPFQESLVVISDGDQLAVLAKNGTVQDNPNITLRSKNTTPRSQPIDGALAQ